MSNNASTSSRRRLVVIVVAAVVVVLALLSAFVWPGWAVRKPAVEATGKATSGQTQSAPATPTIKASPLPGSATELLKAAAPETVEGTAYARVKTQSAQDWASASPIEEYQITYSTGNAAKDLTLVTAQWSDANSAQAQYKKVTDALDGETLAQGSVKVSGAAKGSYLVKADDSDSAKAVAVWQNDTVLFQITGPKAEVLDFYQKFPL
ncbi:hypothetical protein [Bifidobacterium simiarum]|uniref:DUF4245 domain-containing protein n=1 Tax=Bifidobacterium simiarum TaxID=2045441 RepID=A0A2M9HF82_9BIFI|nr:hypothetical protein [Bifidobacterium simiarum]MBT1165478.1 hypothetical protein [Bifidobacterium simiarum]PJM75470.1 hypothetical protein CSQ87_05585 [Bifidobacterium simiarum]